MPRFHVVLCDLQTGEICGEINKFQNECQAVCSHSWISDVYREQWIRDNIMAETVEVMAENLKNLFNYALLCVNLDNEIMRDLNGQEHL